MTSSRHALAGLVSSGSEHSPTLFAHSRDVVARWQVYVGESRTAVASLTGSTAESYVVVLAPPVVVEFTSDSSVIMNGFQAS